MRQQFFGTVVFQGQIDVVDIAMDGTVTITADINTEVVSFFFCELLPHFPLFMRFFRDQMVKGKGLNPLAEGTCGRFVHEEIGILSKMPSP